MSGTNVMSLGDVIKSGVKLSNYECKEIRRYLKIGVFYVGKSSSKRKCVYTKDHTSSKTGFYIVKIGDHIKYQYEILRKIGKGAYGQVIAAFDHKANKKVAIKIFRCGKEAYRKYIEEVRVYEYLNVCYTSGTNELSRMLDHFNFRGHSCLVMELFETDVCSKLRREFRLGYDMETVKTIVISILNGLKSLHEVNIIHGDVKSDNMSFYKKDSAEVKLIDFGSSKFGKQCYRIHSQGRYYRSPEMILCLPFGTAIDMWAMGCVTFELMTGKVLFKGENILDQLICIMEVLGVPPLEMIRSSPAADKLFYECEFPQYCYVKTSDTCYQLVDGTSPTGKQRKHPGTYDKLSKLEEFPMVIDFILKCLELNPEKRITVNDALHHRWLVNQTLLPINTSQEPSSSSTFRASSSSQKISRHLPKLVNQLCTERPTHCPSKRMVRSISLMALEEPSLGLHQRWALVCSNYWKEQNKGTELKIKKKYRHSI